MTCLLHEPGRFCAAKELVSGWYAWLCRRRVVSQSCLCGGVGWRRWYRPEGCHIASKWLKLRSPTKLPWRHLQPLRSVQTGRRKQRGLPYAWVWACLRQRKASPSSSQHLHNVQGEKEEFRPRCISQGAPLIGLWWTNDCAWTCRARNSQLGSIFQLEENVVCLLIVLK